MKTMILVQQRSLTTYSSCTAQKVSAVRRYWRIILIFRNHLQLLANNCALKAISVTSACGFVAMYFRKLRHIEWSAVKSQTPLGGIAGHDPIDVEDRRSRIAVIQSKTSRKSLKNEVWKGFCPFVYPPPRWVWTSFFIYQDGTKLRLSISKCSTVRHYVYYFQ